MWLAAVGFSPLLVWPGRSIRSRVLIILALSFSGIVHVGFFSRYIFFSNLHGRWAFVFFLVLLPSLNVYDKNGGILWRGIGIWFC